MRRLSLCLLLLAASITLYAAPPAAMTPSRLVNDFAGLFTPQQIKSLEDSLVAFDKSTSTQIVVVTLVDLNNAAPSQMAFDIMNAWGVGRKDKNNGVVILIKPRNDTRGEVFIAAGLGLEGILPDGRATRIIDKFMIPHLKQGDYFTAAEAGAAAIRAVTRGEFDGEDEEFPFETFISFLIGFSILFVLFIIMVIAVKKKNNGSDGTPGDQNNGTGGGGMFFPPIFGGFGGFGGGGGGSSSGGGGFGGFGGGGSFGGGGGRSF